MAAKTHKLTPAAKVLLYGLAEEIRVKVITWKEYTLRAKEVMRDDRAGCRKACCKGVGHGV